MTAKLPAASAKHPVPLEESSQEVISQPQRAFGFKLEARLQVINVTLNLFACSEERYRVTLSIHRKVQ